MDKRKDTGNKGENIAAGYLVEQNFVILKRNWRFKYREVDIIASKNNKLHFIEVKTRTNLLFGYPEESIDNSKMNALKKAAQAYLQQYPQWQYIQFDVIAITLQQEMVLEILMIEDVFF